MKEEKTKPKEAAPTAPVKEVSQRPKRRKKKSPLVFTALFVIALVFGAFYFVKYQQLNDKYQELTMTEEERAKKTVAEVAKLYKIPSYDEEKPSIYALKDQKSLDEMKKQNIFFKDASLNDLLLAYQKADSIVLYRPTEKKIINTDKYSTITAGTANIAIIAPADKADATEQQIKQKIKNAVVTEKITPKTSISSGIVVDVTGKEAEAAKKTADLLGYTVGSLPQGETMPTGATFVVIVPNSPAP